MPATDTHPLHESRTYAFVLAATIGTVLLSAWGGLSLGSVAFVVLMIFVAVTGIPHGAIDHLVASEVYGLDQSWRDQAKFYGGYLAVMAAYALLWMVAPVTSFTLFLLMTVYHFGQADLAYLELPSVQAYAAYASRGALLIGLPIAAFPEIVSPIFVAIAGVDLMAWPWLMANQGALVAGLVAQHALLLVGLTAASTPSGRDLGRELLNTTVLASLLGTVHPLVAFAVYFGLWHSLGHILEMLRFFRRQGAAEPTTISGFYRKATLFTIISFLGLAGLYVAYQAFGAEEQMIALLFILISVLTLPHMIIVEAMYQQKKAHPA